jgi:dsRNA-specific ribonuclease
MECQEIQVYRVSMALMESQGDRVNQDQEENKERRVMTVKRAFLEDKGSQDLLVQRVTKVIPEYQADKASKEYRARKVMVECQVKKVKRENRVNQVFKASQD